jgi:hypothetical protein
VSSLAALHQQYQRVVVGRLVPRELPKPAELSSTEYPDAEEMCDTVVNVPQATSQQTSHCKPPSPPPTPTCISKPQQNNVQSTYLLAGLGPRPKNSVFSVFCPEAMKYQVDLEKTLPKKGTMCRCGYEWNSTGKEDRAAIVIKDGFRITSRFLGKSHLEKGLGCVLCTVSCHLKDLISTT